MDVYYFEDLFFKNSKEISKFILKKILCDGNYYIERFCRIFVLWWMSYFVTLQQQKIKISDIKEKT